MGGSHVQTLQPCVAGSEMVGKARPGAGQQRCGRSTLTDEEFKDAPAHARAAMRESFQEHRRTAASAGSISLPSESSALFRRNVASSTGHPRAFNSAVSRLSRSSRRAFVSMSRTPGKTRPVRQATTRARKSRGTSATGLPGGDLRARSLAHTTDVPNVTNARRAIAVTTP